MTPTACLFILLGALSVAPGCSNFRPSDEGATFRAMLRPPRWAPYDGPALPRPRLFPSATPSPVGTIVFGGLGAAGPVGDGWRWDGAAWTALPGEGSPAGRTAHAAISMGESFCVWGGEARGDCFDDGACLDLATARWRPMSTEGAPTPRSAMASAFTGREWIIWGGRDADGNDLADGARYDPRTERWSALPDGGPRARHRAIMAVSPDGARVLVWGGAGEALALGSEDAFILDIQSMRWMPINLDGAPTARSAPWAVEVPGGVAAGGGDVAAVFEWSTGRWRPVDPSPLSARWGSVAVSTPDGVVVWGGRDESGFLADGATLDLTTGRWTSLPGLPTTGARSDAVAILDAHQLIVLWGTGAAGPLGDAFALR